MVKRRVRRPRPGAAAKRSRTRRAKEVPAPPLEDASTAEPITAFTENAGAVWPTPDSLDDAAIASGQAGVENEPADNAAGRGVGPRRRR